jgi:hypothetical protein
LIIPRNSLYEENYENEKLHDEENYENEKLHDKENYEREIETEKCTREKETNDRKTNDCEMKNKNKNDRETKNKNHWETKSKNEESKSKNKETKVKFNIKETKDELAFMAQQSKVKHQIFIGDSGASCHMVSDDTNMFDTKTIKEFITIGNGETVKATKVGKKRILIQEKDGTIKSVTLSNVKYVPELGHYNLLSITYALRKGFQLSNCGETIILKKGETEIKFEHKVETKSGYVGAIVTIQDELIKSENKRANEIICQSIERKMKLSINDAHKIFGHTVVANTLGFILFLYNFSTSFIKLIKIYSIIVFTIEELVPKVFSIKVIFNHTF